MGILVHRNKKEKTTEAQRHGKPESRKASRRYTVINQQWCRWSFAKKDVMMVYRQLWLALIVLALFSASVVGSVVLPEETEPCNWPQFRGPRRDSLSGDTGLLKRWPERGPRLIWKAAAIGYGFSSVAIADGMIYTAGNMDGDTVITALDMSGSTLWQTRGGPAFTKSHPGSRGTPTVSDDKVYHLNGNGYVVCLEAKTGRKIWMLNILEKFRGQNSEWGLSESLLVDGENVICCPGGEEVSIVALNKDTGETVWICTGVGEKPAYVSPILVNYKGLRQIITVMYASAIGVAADTGELLWRYDHPVKYGSNISTPIYHDGHIVLFRTFGLGATMLKLNVRDHTCTVEEVWHTEELDNEHGGVVLVNGYLYGHADGNHKWRHWACLELETGKTMYSVAGLPAEASGTLTYADGMLYLLGEPGNVALMSADPESFDITSQFQLPKGGKGPVRAHPVVCGGRFYIRHGDFLYAYDVCSEGTAN
jgi:outer membrane protein assembly factor BamB